jgi:hypothetical protein
MLVRGEFDLTRLRKEPAGGFLGIARVAYNRKDPVRRGRPPNSCNGRVPATMERSERDVYKIGKS